MFTLRTVHVLASENLVKVNQLMMHYKKAKENKHGKRRKAAKAEETRPLSSVNQLSPMDSCGITLHHHHQSILFHCFLLGLVKFVGI